MADTTSTTANDIYFAAWVGDRIVDEQRPYLVAKGLTRFEGRRPTKAFDFPTMDDPGAASSNVAEGTAFTTTTLATSKATATALQNGQVALVEDVLDAIALVDVISYFSQVLGRSCAEEYEVTVDALYAGFGTAITSSGVDATVDDFMAAISALEQADVMGTIVAVFHPVTVGDIRSSVANQGGAIWGSPSDKGSSVVEGKFNGYAGNLLGVDVFMSTAVPTANAGADRAGGMFVKGEALGEYQVWDTRVESHRDVFEPGTQLAATNMYGVCEILDRLGVEFTFDA